MDQKIKILILVCILVSCKEQSVDKEEEKMVTLSRELIQTVEMIKNKKKVSKDSAKLITRFFSLYTLINDSELPRSYLLVQSLKEYIGEPDLVESKVDEIFLTYFVSDMNYLLFTIKNDIVVDVSLSYYVR